MQATDLGRYLFYGRAADFLALSGDSVVSAAQPSDAADWTVDEDGDAFTIVNEHAGRQLAVGDGGALVAVPAGGAGGAGRFEFEPADGCPRVPGGRHQRQRPPVDRQAGLRRGLGPDRGPHPRDGVRVPRRRAHCGRPWHRFGAPFALRDCPDHELGHGCAAVLENVLYGEPGALPRPGWLADLRRVARLQVAHPRADVLALARARLARGPARVREPLRREPDPLPGLPVQAEQLQRDGQRPAAGAANPRAPGLHRRPVRRSRQGLLPHRQQPVSRPAR